MPYCIGKLEEKALKDNFFYLVLIIVTLFLFRVIPHPPNVSPIIAFGVASPIFFKNKINCTFLLLLAMFLSDIILGFHSYQLIIYLTLTTIILVSSSNQSFTKISILGIAASVWFFLVTNFSVWILWDYYPKNIEGLLSCYVLALPFFQNTLLSTLFFLWLVYLTRNLIGTYNEKIINYITSFNLQFK
jgi:hypothetical protein